ncbi:hypothetical protein [Microbacterium murale]|uniref:Uncharacterized protein n=1 Tax=Microbacterium murale TaxID=1081040 RepID=A0ABU0P609_9MICO|nr:hypothetical protein [Microbacterium murale]MDQ0642758.1 hypothetical protein [Microbacterium murale]
MPQPLRTFGRILARHWPALIAWYLGGEALHQLLVQLAGFVGGYTTLGGLLLLPLAVAAKLIAYVAMYLTVRRSLPHVVRPEGEGYREFAVAILVSILPFFAFYSAWGMLNADLIEFFNIASSVAFFDTKFDAEQLADRGGRVSVGALPIAVLVIALALRLALSKYSSRLPSWTLALAAYAEVLWTFMLFTLVVQWWAGVEEWLGGTVGMGWLQGIGDWFAINIAPVAALWEGVQWLIGVLAAVLLVPAAWLAVAGVIYGTTFDSAPAVVQRGLAALRGTAATLSRTLLQRFESLWAAVAVVWRGGPVIFGGAVLAYALWALAERLGTRGLLQLIGGHETWFWSAFLPLITIAVAVIAEPLRVAIVATVYDAVIARPEAGLEAREMEAGAGVHTLPSRLDGEAGHLAEFAGNVEVERADGIVRDEEDSKDRVGE